jgi:hypothetical protein
VVRRALADPTGSIQVTGVQPLKRRVVRLHLDDAGRARTVVAKRLDPIEALRTELLARRWLPAEDLGANGPGLLGVSATARGRWIWHVYEDLGETTLAGREADLPAVEAVVRLVARIHSRFAAHPLLAECRPFGVFDITGYSANVRDALRGLALLRRPDLGLSAEHAALRDRLIARLERLQESTPRRARALEECGGPETLLHGDLWTSNAFATRTTWGLVPRLIDWDRAGVGPMSYDLSAFLLRFPRATRPWLVELYASSLENGAWRLPATDRLNLLLETAELARYANRVIWPALAIGRDRAAWGFTELAEVERWFEAFEPVVPS